MARVFKEVPTEYYVLEAIEHISKSHKDRSPFHEVPFTSVAQRLRERFPGIDQPQPPSSSELITLRGRDPEAFRKALEQLNQDNKLDIVTDALAMSGAIIINYDDHLRKSTVALTDPGQVMYHDFGYLKRLLDAHPGKSVYLP